MSEPIKFSIRGCQFSRHSDEKWYMSGSGMVWHPIEDDKWILFLEYIAEQDSVLTALHEENKSNKYALDKVVKDLLSVGEKVKDLIASYEMWELDIESEVATKADAMDYIEESINELAAALLDQEEGPKSDE